MISFPPRSVQHDDYCFVGICPCGALFTDLLPSSFCITCSNQIRAWAYRDGPKEALPPARTQRKAGAEQRILI